MLCKGKDKTGLCTRFLLQISPSKATNEEDAYIRELALEPDVSLQPEAFWYQRINIKLYPVLRRHWWQHDFPSLAQCEWIAHEYPALGKSHPIFFNLASRYVFIASCASPGGFQTWQVCPWFWNFGRWSWHRNSVHLLDSARKKNGHSTVHGRTSDEHPRTAARRRQNDFAYGTLHPENASRRLQESFLCWRPEIPCWSVDQKGRRRRDHVHSSRRYIYSVLNCVMLARTKRGFCARFVRVGCGYVTQWLLIYRIVHKGNVHHRSHW